MKKLNIKDWIMPFVILVLISGIHQTQAQTRIKSVPFSFQAEASEDKYLQRIREKSLLTPEGNVVLLRKKSERDYAVAAYNGDLKLLWETVLPVSDQEDLEAFSQNGQSALILTHRQATGGTSQALYGHLFDLKTGRKSEAKKLFEAPAKSRRIGTAISADGNRLVAFQYLYQQDQLKTLEATVYDGSLGKIKDRSYNLRDLAGILSATVRIDNNGDQYVALITNKASKLSVRRYNTTSNEVKGMDVQVGGVFEGKNVYVLDTYFTVPQSGQLFAAALCADEKTGDYHSLKLVKFDFNGGDMKFAPEFRFLPQYLADVNKISKGGEPAKRLEDIYLSDLVFSAESQVMVVAEKKYREGPKKPLVAREMHLFAYDDYLNPTWHSVLNKHQQAPSTEGFSAISYKGRVFGNQFHVVTLETLNGKTDLFSRKINLQNGMTEAPVALGLNGTSPEALAYIKDFTTWLNERTLLVVAKPAKKAATLQLNKITTK